MKKILVTGAAGFIGHFVSKRLLERGDVVVGLDNLNDYYDPSLKEARLQQIKRLPGAERFTFIKVSLEDQTSIHNLFENYLFDAAVHLGAQAGVRFSLSHPQTYIQSNITGFLNVLEGMRAQRSALGLGETLYAGNGPHLVYASSSSVYGGNKTMPFSETQQADRPISLYAATKRANELMGHTYSHLFGIPMTGLRFFTVYGPWGRPDMAAFKFVKAILAGNSVEVYNHGKMQRDFTYIDDIVEGIVRVLDHPPSALPTSDSDFSFERLPPHRVLNIGNQHPESLTEFICAIEDALGIKAKKKFLEMQPGDVPATYADIAALKDLTGFVPLTPLKEGVQKFVNWYLDYYR